MYSLKIEDSNILCEKEDMQYEWQKQQYIEHFEDNGIHQLRIT